MKKLMLSMLLISLLACSNEEALNLNEEVLQKTKKEGNINFQSEAIVPIPSGKLPCTDASEVCDSTNLPFGSEPYYFFGSNAFHGVIYTNDPRKAVVVDFIYGYNLQNELEIYHSSVVAHGLKMKINMKHIYVTNDGKVKVQYVGNYSYLHEAIGSHLDEDYGGLEVNLDSISTIISNTANPTITETYMFTNTFTVDLVNQTVN